MLETLIYLLIAFVGAWVLIVLAKIVLQALIRRPERYYEDVEAAEEAAMLANVKVADTKNEKKGK